MQAARISSQPRGQAQRGHKDTGVSGVRSFPGADAIRTGRLMHRMLALAGAVAVAVLLMTARTAAAQPAPAPSAGPTLEVISRIVYVDVVVRDKAGRPIHGLHQADFMLREDGSPQQVALFEEHMPGLLPSAAKTKKNEAREYANVSQGASANGVNVVLLDLVNTTFLDRVFARQQMLTFLRRLPPGRQTALFVLSDHLHMLQGFTGDASLLAQAAAAVEPSQLDRTTSREKALRDNETVAYIEQGLAGRPSRLADAIRVGLAQEEGENTKVREESTADAFAELARALSGYAGRKNVFWLAGSFPPNELMTIQTAGVVGEQSASLRFNGPHSLQQVLRDAQLSIYPISVVGVETDSIGAGASGLDEGAGSSNQAGFFRRQDIRSTMDTIARQTGGRSFYGTNDIAAALEQGFQDGENFYTLAYQPSDHNWTKTLRHISVDVDRGGLQLDYRRTYLALPPNTQAHPLREFQLAMASDIPSTALSFHAIPRVAATSVAVEMTVDLPGINFTTDAQGRRNARLLVAVSALPLHGKPGKPVVQQSGYLNLSLTPQQYAAMLESGVATRHTVALGKGDYTVRVGVYDMADGNIGTITMPISIP